MQGILAYNTTLAVLTIVGLVALVKWVLILTVFRKQAEGLALYQWFINKKIWLWAATVLSFVAVLGTLIYSEAIGFPPCRLCWFQRVFMYPTLVLLVASLVRKETIIVPYIKLLSFAGAWIALYHYVVQMSPSISAACGATGAACGERLVFEFGFVTIPFMSLVIFAMIFTLMFFKKPSK